MDDHSPVPLGVGMSLLGMCLLVLCLSERDQMDANRRALAGWARILNRMLHRLVA